MDKWYKKELMPQFKNKALKNNTEYQDITTKHLQNSANFFAEIPLQPPSIGFTVHNGHSFILHCISSMYLNATICENNASLEISKQDDSFEQWREAEEHNAFFEQKIIPIVHQLLVFKQKQAATSYNINIDTMKRLFTERSQINNFFDKALKERIQQKKDFINIIENGKKQNFKRLTNIIKKRPELINTLNIKAAPFNATINITPLMHAVDSGKSDLLKHLLKFNILINAKNKKGYTALTYAQPKKYFNTVKILLERGAKRCCDSHRPECFSQPSRGMLKHPPFLPLKVLILNFIREHNGSHAKNEQIDVSILHPTLLVYPKVIDPAFERRFQTSLKQKEVKEKLKKIVASWQDSENNLNRLKDALKEFPHLINNKITLFETPLIYAIEKGKITLIQPLLDLNALIDKPDYAYNTPLSHVKDHHIIKLLLERGADPHKSCIKPEKYPEPSRSMLKHPPFLSLKVRILNFIREHNGTHAKTEQINTSSLPSLLLQYPKVVDPAFEQRIESYHKAL